LNYCFAGSQPSVYFALTEWHEAAPAQLISNMEKVSVTTVRNRLNAARELGLIAKPDSGKRKAK
jgi:predicted transcriptional regulator